MANTTTDKLRLLLNNKANIKIALVEAGAPVTEQTPLSEYPGLITTLSTITDTTSTEDIMIACDLYNGMYYGGCDTNYGYTEEEQLMVENLTNLIIEGV